MADRYIVTLRPGANVHRHILSAQKTLAQSAATFTLGGFEGIRHNFTMPGFVGYAGHFSQAVVRVIGQAVDVRRIEPDQPCHIAQLTSQPRASWNLVAISHRQATDAFDSYKYDQRAGRGTWAYVIDSGINIRHCDFQGRAERGINTVRPIVPFQDTIGHGTHAAGVIGGRLHGVAKLARIVDVKVLDGPSGHASDVLAGYAWAVRDILENCLARIAVINMSLQLKQAPMALIDAIGSAFSCGITTVIAAGNAGAVTPWSPPAIVVSAVDSNVNRLAQSNYGPGVSLFAPGSGIISAWTGSPWSFNTMSGTSPATAHVAGVILLLKSTRQLLNARATTQALLGLASPHLVGSARNARNLFLYNGSGA